MSQLWKDEVIAGSPNGAVIAVNQWLARLTLDVIGEGEIYPDPRTLYYH